MNINDKLTQALALTVEQVIENKEDFKPHTMYDPKTGKSYEAKTYEDHLKMQEMGYSHEKPSKKNEADYRASGKSGKAFADLHLSNIEIVDDPEQEKQVESTEISEAVDNFFGFPTKDKLVKFQSMAKKLKIKPISNPTVMKRGGKEFHVMGFEGSVRDIEKAMKVANDLYNEAVKIGEELSAKQKKIDLNKNGKVDGDDLAQLRKKAKKDESVEVEESAELQEAASFGDIEKVMKWAKKNLTGAKLDISKKYGTAFINLTIFNVITLRLGGKKGIVVIHDDRTKGKGKDYEEHFSSANDVIKFVEKIYDEMPKDESVTDDEGEAMDANKKEVEKSVKDIGKAESYSSNIISKILEKKNTEIEEATELFDKGKITLTRFSMGGKGKLGLQINYGMNAIQVPEKDINTLLTGLNTAFKNFKKGLGESVFDIKEGQYDKLEKKLGRINPDTLGDVLKGKIKLNPAEKKEFDHFMKGARKMFASESVEEITEETFNMFFDGYDSDWHYLKQDAKKMRAKLTNIETQFGDEYYFTMDTTKSNLKKLLKKYGDLELEESVNEAVQPKDFIKGGDKKVSSKDVGDVMDRIFLNDRLMKQLEKTGAFKEGKNDKGKKKNPYKKDTIDFHHYELGVDAGQAGF